MPCAPAQPHVTELQDDLGGPCCSESGGSLVCGSSGEAAQQAMQDALVNSNAYTMVSWLSFRSWGNSGAAFLGGDVIAGKDYSWADATPTQETAAWGGRKQPGHGPQIREETCTIST